MTSRRARVLTEEEATTAAVEIVVVAVDVAPARETDTVASRTDDVAPGRIVEAAGSAVVVSIGSSILGIPGPNRVLLFPHWLRRSFHCSSLSPSRRF